MKSFFKFLSRNRLYTFINLFGLSVSLMFVVLLASYVKSQLSTDRFHVNGDRVVVVANEETINSSYWLGKHIRDRYPEVESNCIVGSTIEKEDIDFVGNKFAAKTLNADSTFFRFFSFRLLQGNPDEVLDTKEKVVLTERFARKVFGDLNPMGQQLTLSGGNKVTVSGIMDNISGSVFPDDVDMLRSSLFLLNNNANDERMSNAGSMITFLLLRPGTDLNVKLPDMVSWLKEIYWVYTENYYSTVSLVPLKEIYFLDLEKGDLNSGSRNMVMLLFTVCLIALLFAVINYINLTIAQTGFRGREMAARRLLGASKGSVVFKMVSESTLMCALAFALSLCLGQIFVPSVSKLLNYPIDLFASIDFATVAVCVVFVIVLGVVAGLAPALVVLRYKPIDLMKGAMRSRSKMVWGKVLIAVQNIVTITMVVVALVISLQTRHLVNAPLGYNTDNILYFYNGGLFKSYQQWSSFTKELGHLAQIEAVSGACGTPLDRGNNMTYRYGTDRMVSFQLFQADSAFFKIFGLECLQDNHSANRYDYWLNEYAFKEMGIDRDAAEFKVGKQFEHSFNIAGVYRDFQVGNILREPTSVAIVNVGDFDSFQDYEQGWNKFPWHTIVKISGDRVQARNAVIDLYNRTVGVGTIEPDYYDDKIKEGFAKEQQLSTIVSIFTFVAVLISMLGLLAMSTFYIQQRRSQIAVRRVFGSTRKEILDRLLGEFMKIVAVAAVVAVPLSYYLVDRWLGTYSYRVGLGWWIFAVAVVFDFAIALLTVLWQSKRAADTNPVDSLRG